MGEAVNRLRWWWFESPGYWWWRRLTHALNCGGKFEHPDGGCENCDLLRSRKVSADVTA